MTESRLGRKKLHGRPAYAGDIAQIFDYQTTPCEKETAAEVIGDGVPSLWEDGAEDGLGARVARFAAKRRS
jgi:hypothetical protein